MKNMITNTASLLVMFTLLILLAGMNCNNSVQDAIAQPAAVPANVQVNFDVIEQAQCNLALNLDTLREKVRRLKSSVPTNTDTIIPVNDTLNFTKQLYQ